jgi:hypothetical protein
MVIESSKFRIIMKFLIIPWYLVCWELSYHLINQGFYGSQSYDYFVMAWTFSGGVRPFYTWVFSLLIFLLSAGGVALVTRNRKIKNNSKD